MNISSVFLLLLFEIVASSRTYMNYSLPFNNSKVTCHPFPESSYSYEQSVRCNDTSFFKLFLFRRHFSYYFPMEISAFENRKFINFWKSYETSPMYDTKKGIFVRQESYRTTTAHFEEIQLTSNHSDGFMLTSYSGNLKSSYGHRIIYQKRICAKRATGGFRVKLSVSPIYQDSNQSVNFLEAAMDEQISLLRLQAVIMEQQCINPRRIILESKMVFSSENSPIFQEIKPIESVQVSKMILMIRQFAYQELYPSRPPTISFDSSTILPAIKSFDTEDISKKETDKKAESHMDQEPPFWNKYTIVPCVSLGITLIVVWAVHQERLVKYLPSSTPLILTPAAATFRMLAIIKKDKGEGQVKEETV